MEGETVTIQQAMAMLGRSEKRVRDYILKDKKLTAEIGEDGKYHILKSDVEHLAKHPGQIQVDKVTRRIEEIEKRLSTIEQVLGNLSTRLDEMNSRLDTLTTHPTVQSPRSPALQERQRSQPQPRVSAAVAGGDKGLPEGAILASYFAKAHDVKPRTFADQCKLGRDGELAPVSQRPKPGREHLGEVEYYILPEQVAGVLDYWRRHGVPFTETTQDQAD